MGFQGTNSGFSPTHSLLKQSLPARARAPSKQLRTTKIRATALFWQQQVSTSMPRYLPQNWVLIFVKRGFVLVPKFVKNNLLVCIIVRKSFQFNAVCKWFKCIHCVFVLFIQFSELLKPCLNFFRKNSISFFNGIELCNFNFKLFDVS